VAAFLVLSPASRYGRLPVHVGAVIGRANGCDIRIATRYSLRDGDLVRIGSVLLKFLAGTPEPPARRPSSPS
jgi:hypothetical protein